MTALLPAPAPGLHRGVPFRDYCSWDAVSRSELVELARSPAHYRWSKDQPEPEASPWIGPSNYLELGVAIHEAVLLGESFEAKYAIGPDVDLRTKKGEAAWLAFAAEHPGKMLLRAECGETCLAIRDAVWQSPLARQLLAGEGGESELSVVFERDGVRCKARPDRYLPDTPRGPVIVDLKSATNAEPRAWMRDAIARKLHYQVAWYCDAMTAATGREHTAGDLYFLVYEKGPPYCCSVHQFDREAVTQARREIADLLEILRRCEESGEWPDYSRIVHQISLPDWAKGLGSEADLMLKRGA